MLILHNGYDVRYYVTSAGLNRYTFHHILWKKVPSFWLRSFCSTSSIGRTKCRILTHYPYLALAIDSFYTTFAQMLLMDILLPVLLCWAYLFGYSHWLATAPHQQCLRAMTHICDDFVLKLINAFAIKDSLSKLYNSFGKNSSQISGADTSKHSKLSRGDSLRCKFWSSRRWFIHNLCHIWPTISSHT